MRSVLLCVLGLIAQCVSSVAGALIAAWATSGWSASRVGPVMLGVMGFQFVVALGVARMLWVSLSPSAGKPYLFGAFAFVQLCLAGLFILSNFILFNR